MRKMIIKVEFIVTVAVDEGILATEVVDSLGVINTDEDQTTFDLQDCSIINWRVEDSKLEKGNE